MKFTKITSCETAIALGLSDSPVKEANEVLGGSFGRVIPTLSVNCQQMSVSNCGSLSSELNRKTSSEAF